MTPTEKLSERARKLRESLGLTRPQLAEMAGVTAAHVYHIETGRRNRMRPDTLERYAKALNVSPTYLEMGFDAAPTPDEWPPLPVLLRHTHHLSESGIAQVERFVRALEMEERAAGVVEELPGNQDDSVAS